MGLSLESVYDYSNFHTVIFQLCHSNVNKDTKQTTHQPKAIFHPTPVMHSTSHPHNHSSPLHSPTIHYSSSV